MLKLCVMPSICPGLLNYPLGDFDCSGILIVDLILILNFQLFRHKCRCDEIMSERNGKIYVNLLTSPVVGRKMNL